MAYIYSHTESSPFAIAKVITQPKVFIFTSHLNCKLSNFIGIFVLTYIFATRLDKQFRYLQVAIISLSSQVDVGS